MTPALRRVRAAANIEAEQGGRADELTAEKTTRAGEHRALEVACDDERLGWWPRCVPHNNRWVSQTTISSGIHSIPLNPTTKLYKKTYNETKKKLGWFKLSHPNTRWVQSNLQNWVGVKHT